MQALTLSHVSPGFKVDDVSWTGRAVANDRDRSDHLVGGLLKNLTFRVAAL